MDERTRNPAITALRGAAAMIGALVASAPAFVGAVAGRRSLVDALGWYLAALAVLWAIGGVVQFALRVPGSAGTDR